MVTFLPLPSFDDSFQVLDMRRLGKQRIEALTIYQTITGTTDRMGWRGHPVMKMWVGYEHALALYHNTCLDEWERRGYTNNMKRLGVGKVEMPNWFGNPDFHASHRAALLLKAPEWYGKFGWSEQPRLEYKWPLSDRLR